MAGISERLANVASRLRQLLPMHAAAKRFNRHLGRNPNTAPRRTGTNQGESSGFVSSTLNRFFIINLVCTIVEWAFGKRMTPAERLRKHQRALEKTQRELDRERVKLENQEKKLVQDIKKSAKAGQMGPLRIQAKDLVRTRRYIQKFYQMRTQLQAISLRIQTVRSNEQMMQSMKGATTLLGSMNRQMNLPALQRIAMEFEKENDIMDQRQEMMDDAIDDVTGLEDEEEGEEVVNQVLDEIGIDLGQTVQGFLGPCSNPRREVPPAGRASGSRLGIRSAPGRALPLERHYPHEWKKPCTHPQPPMPCRRGPRGAVVPPPFWEAQE
ncbi:hypothetical protein FH972_026252 [Carpinus fangiana]|uniref:Uncharacterized protein n=1 Tax=Carpinus fangiana TaxID=176857 RepID=A0A5N6L4F4_9ROSI|nr:hypothetical protein FH972_026252 [Carpinus fangiana]